MQKKAGAVSGRPRPTVRIEDQKLIFTSISEMRRPVLSGASPKAFAFELVTEASAALAFRLVKFSVMSFGATDPSCRIESFNRYNAVA